MSNLPALEERRSTKIKKKSDARGVEFGVVKAEFAIDRTEAKQANKGGHGVYYEGYASIFNTEDSYKDIIVPGAFKSSLKEKGPKLNKKTGQIDSDIPALWQHNPDWPFGLTVDAKEDDIGLYQRTNVPVNDTNMERLDWMEFRIVKGQSIGFVTLDSEWDEEDEDEWFPTRWIKKIDLWEHSAVTFPAHSDALTELVQRNRELALAVKSTDHGQLLEFATKMKGITVPAVEETIGFMRQFLGALKSLQEEGGEADEEPDQENPVDSGETSAEDPELVKALELWALQMKADEFNRSLVKATGMSGGR